MTKLEADKHLRAKQRKARTNCIITCLESSGIVIIISYIAPFLTF